MRKCLILQFEPRHEEVIPSLIAACNGAGYKPTVLLNRRIRRIRGDVFEQVRGGDADIQYTSLSTDENMDWDSLLADVDFVFLNTLNRVRVAEWASRCGKPVIAMIHNVDQFIKTPECIGLLDRPDFAFMTLAPHVTAEMNAQTDAKYVDKLGLLTYCVLADTPVAYNVEEMRKIVVPGNLSLRSRNYAALIETLSAHPDKWQNLKFEFPSSGVDRAEVVSVISQHGLEKRINVLPLGDQPEIPHSEVFESFRSATIFHPLIAEGFAQYQRIKITSTASMSVGFGVPMIMDRYSEACYRFPMLVSDNTVQATLDRLSGVEDEELVEIHSALAAYRSRMMKRSAEELARLIGRVV